MKDHSLMLNRILRVLLLVTIPFVYSCTDFQEDEAVYFSVAAAQLDFTTAPSSQSLKVTSGKKWDVTSMPEWISLQSISRTASSPYEWDVIFFAKSNEEYNREGVIRIKSGADVADISVTQEGKKGEYVPVESISISSTTLTLTEGETTTMTYEIKPANASIKLVSWKSSSPSIATVGTQSGRIDAIAEGTTQITVTTYDGNKTASCSVTVKAKNIPVESVSLDQTSLYLTEGNTQTLIATVSPSNATDKSVTWTSSNTTVASVSSSGLVSALSPGEATITVKTNNGAKTATCKVNVKSKSIAVTGVSLNKTTLSLTIGESELLYATVSPSDATDKSVSWESSNSSVATVSTSGLVTAKSTGEATITVKTNDGAKTATCKVMVSPISVTGVSLNKSTLSLYENESETLTATVMPSNATNKTVHWSSSNNSVVTVDSDGKVNAKAAGNAVITVTTEDGQKTASCSVNVKSDPYGAVDLGLSVKWAPFNYGASAENEVGGYYKWGDPTGEAIGYTFTPPSVNSICGTQYDVVRAHWGGDWRIPTAAEIVELKKNCTMTWTSVGDVSGVRFTGKNGNSIFLPASGYAFHSTQWATSETTGYSDTETAYLMAGTSYYDSSWEGRVTYLYVFSEESFTAYYLQRVVNSMSFPIRPVR